MTAPLIAQELQKFTVDDQVELFEIDATELFGEILRFTPAPLVPDPAAPVATEITWRGDVYVPKPCETSGWVWDGVGPLPTPTMKLGNTDLSISALAIAYGDMLGVTVTRHRTFRKFLDGQPAADPDVELDPDIYRIERKTSQNKSYVEFELGTAIDVQGRKLPGRQVLQGFCPARYRRWSASAPLSLSDFLTCARSGPAIAYAQNAAGVLVPFAANVPRITDFGLLVEEQRTNLITNSGGLGASGATAPNLWTVDQGFGGISPSGWASATDANGYGYAQFTINGTTSISNRLLITPTNARAAVTAGQSYACSYNYALLSGAYAYGLQMTYLWYNSGGVNISTSSGASVLPSSSTPTRQVDVVTAPALATEVRIRWDFVNYNGPSGTALNFAFALGGVQFELGSKATSYIPTTSAAVTRNADSESPLGSLLDALKGSAATIYIEAGYATGPSTYPARLVAGQGSTEILGVEGNKAGMYNNDFPAALDTSNTATWTTALNKLASAFDATGRSVVLNGGAIATDGHPVGDRTTCYIGSESGTNNSWNGYIQRIAVWGHRLTDAQLQALTLSGNTFGATIDLDFRTGIYLGSGFDYSKATCPYTGTNYFALDGTPVIDPSLDRAPKRLNLCCAKRFPNQPLPFFGFPGVARFK